MEQQDACTTIQGRLDDLEDRVLAGPAARAARAHLNACERCRGELERRRALRAALRSLPGTRGAEEARERVFARFRETLTTEEESAGRRSGWTVPGWLLRPSAAFSLATATAVLVAVCIPVEPVEAPASRAVLLPSAREMAVLSERHDHHVAQVEDRRPGEASPGAAVPTDPAEASR